MAAAQLAEVKAAAISLLFGGKSEIILDIPSVICRMMIRLLQTGRSKCTHGRLAEQVRGLGCDSSFTYTIYLDFFLFSERAKDTNYTSRQLLILCRT
jgi:hypothetical protein